MNDFFIFPSGIFEDESTKSYSVYKRRSMPCTPAGDVVIEGRSKEFCESIIDRITSGNCSLQDAINVALREKEND